MRLFLNGSDSRSHLPEGADWLSPTASSLCPGEALDFALAEDRRERELRKDSFSRRVRTVWLVYGWMNGLFPVIVVGLSATVVLCCDSHIPIIGLRDFLAPMVLISFLFGITFWLGIRDRVGRALLSLFLDAARREQIGIEPSDSGQPHEI